MLITVIRTLILYLVVIFVMRLMGKRQIGELQPIEFVVTLMIAELGAVPMEDIGIPLLKGIIPIFILLGAQISFSYFSMKSQMFRNIVCGTPSILINKGQIMVPEMQNLRYNINELLEQLRLKGYPNINEVEYAILETNGELTVMPKAEFDSVKLKDLHVFPDQPKLPVSLVIDGKVQKDNLARVQMNKEALRAQLLKFEITDPEKALIAIMDSGGNFYAQPKTLA